MLFRLVPCALPTIFQMIISAQRVSGRFCSFIDQPCFCLASTLLEALYASSMLSHYLCTRVLNVSTEDVFCNSRCAACLLVIVVTQVCICRYMSSNPQYADSSTYAGKFRQLQARAMATMRSKVQQVLRSSCDQVGLPPSKPKLHAECAQRWYLPMPCHQMTHVLLSACAYAGV